jgi:hypothetical protein
MSEATRSPAGLGGHAVCMAASVRDILRAAQFYTRDMSNVDGRFSPERGAAPFLSRLVARVARITDGFMTWGANLAISVILPGWRKLPSPFTPGMVAEVADAIRSNSLLHNPLFNAYFYRAAIHITERYTEPPHLMLEHRVDAARRQLAAAADDGPAAPEAVFLARTLMALVQAAPVARVGKPRSQGSLLAEVEPNVAVFAIACVTLMFAEEGKPMASVDDDEFFSIVGALIQPRLKGLERLITARDEQALAQELLAIKDMY